MIGGKQDGPESRGVSRIFFLGGPDRVTICRGVAYCIDI